MKNSARSKPTSPVNLRLGEAGKFRENAVQIDRIGHLNITVADLDRSLDFYERVLGMRTERMGEGSAALLFGNQKIDLDVAGATAMAGDKRLPPHTCRVTCTT